LTTSPERRVLRARLAELVQQDPIGCPRCS
jgi:hypothetical protein